jgi:hypothetical protein
MIGNRFVILSFLFLVDMFSVSRSFHFGPSFRTLRCGSVLRCFSSSQNTLYTDPLHIELKDWRKRTADELQKPVYQVVNNQLLENIVRYKPMSTEQLSLMSGVGRFTLNRYGKKILDIVKKHYPENNENSIYEAETESFWLAAKAKKEEKPKKTAKKSSKTAANSSSPPGTEKAESNVVPKKPRRKAIPVMSLSQIDEYEQTHIPDRVQFDDLNDEQQAGALKILEGKNMFITGNAGTGKSYLLRYVIRELIQRYGEDSVAVTAPTGIAAINLNGQTIHSFAGIGLANGDKATLVKRVMKDPVATDRWLKCKTLIIDEVSMLDTRLFEILHEVACAVRESNEPFGGIQIILVGDFLQLPPVRRLTISRKITGDEEINFKENDKDSFPTKKAPQLEMTGFCFESPVWIEAGLHLADAWIYLKKIERQKDDEEFIQYLNEIRIGKMSNQCIKKLSECLIDKKPLPTNGIIPTKLYAVNKQVDEENLQQLAALPGDVVQMQSIDKWKRKAKNAHTSKLLLEMSEAQIPAKIDLKIGAQVMLLRNRSMQTFGGQIRLTGPSLVNGSRGKVVAFTESTQTPGMIIPTVLFDNGLKVTIGPVDYEVRLGDKEDGELVRRQIPLKLAW